MLRYLVEFATPIHILTIAHHVKETTFQNLKIHLLYVLVVEPPNWNRKLHASINISNVMIGNILMKLYELK